MDEVWRDEIADAGEPLPVQRRVTSFDGRIWSVVTEDIDFGPVVATRDIVIHPGAVAVIALDDEDRVLLIRQYRHPVGQYLFEPPAGLMDTLTESGWQTAQRELAEEAGYRAREWRVLLDMYLSPGGTSEAIRIFLARDLEPLPEGREHTGEAEEGHLPRAWVPLEEARDLILDGRIGSPTAVAGVLAALASRSRGWDALRGPDAPWSERERLTGIGRVREPRPQGS